MCLWLLLRWETHRCSAVTAFHSSCQSINPSLPAFKNPLVDFVPTVRPTPPDSYSPADVHRCLFRGVFIHIVENTPASSRLVLKWVRYNLCTAIWTIYREPPTGHTCFYLFLNFCQALTCRLAPSPNDWQASDFPTLGISAGDHCTERHKSVFHFPPPVNELFFHSLCEISFCFANCKCFKCLLGEN